MGSIKKEANDEARSRHDTFHQKRRYPDKATLIDCGYGCGMNATLSQSEVVQDVTMDAQLLGFVYRYCARMR